MSPLRALGHVGRALFDRLGAHPHDLPIVAVEVVEAALVHEPVIHRILGGRGPGVQRRVGEGVDRFPAVGGDADDRLSTRASAIGLEAKSAKRDSAISIT